MATEFLLLTGAKLQALPPTQTVFFFPVAPLEGHGPHLPVGLDLLEAQKLCFLAAERLEREMPGWVGVIMPPAPLGIETNTGAVALTVRGYVLRDYLIDSCSGLVRAGFRHFVCFSGHLGPKQLTAVEEAGRRITRRKPAFLGSRGGATLVSASSALVTGREVMRAPFGGGAPEHGGARDTSVALAMGGLNGGWVDPNYSTLQSLEAPRTPLGKIFAGILRPRDGGGYWGNPSLASVEEGNRVFAGTMDQLFPKLRAVWEGANANTLFRSWYSVIPFHRSFYRAWVLTLIISAMLLGWIWIALNQMVSE